MSASAPSLSPVLACPHTRSPSLQAWLIQRVAELDDRRLISPCAVCGSTCAEMLVCLSHDCIFSGCHRCCYSHFKSHLEEFPTHTLAVRKDRQPVCLSCYADPLPLLPLRHAVGLHNLFNTCYLNAALQALAHVPAFAAFFLDCSGAINLTGLSSLTRRTAAVVRALWLGQRDVHVPEAFVNRVRNTSRQFASYGQQDSQEFVRWLVDNMHEELRTAHPAAAKESAMSKIFAGELESTIICSDCGHTSVTREPFFDLLVELPDAATLARMHGVAAPSPWRSWWQWLAGESFASGPRPTLLECLQAFVASEALQGANQYACERCKGLRNATKSMRLSRLPEVLCVTLKRFRHDGIRSSKISRFCQFPARDFDLQSLLGDASADSRSRYELTSLVSHSGGVGGGHYVAYARNTMTQQWHLFDDSLAAEVSEEEVLAQQAYVLFYRKQAGEPAVVPALLEAEDSTSEPRDLLVSRSWLCQALSFARAGPIDNSDFACMHGALLPTSAVPVSDLAQPVSLKTYLQLRDLFGAMGPPVYACVGVCAACKEEVERLERRRDEEKRGFNASRMAVGRSTRHYYVSQSWLRQWLEFVEGKSNTPPGPIDNKALVKEDGQVVNGVDTKAMATGAASWAFFHGIYGGGPAIAAEELDSDSD